MRKQTTAAFSRILDAMIAPAVPTPAKAGKTAAKSRARPAKPPAKPRTGAAKAATRPKAGVQAPATFRARTTPPRGASFRTALHDSLYGRRSYRLYVPAAAATATAPLPLLVMLHGCGQTPEDFARGTGMNALAEEFGLLVVYPAQARKDHRNRCWNWYRRADQIRDSGEPGLIASLTRHILAEHPADPAKVYVAGLSAGASAALIVAAAYPDLFAAVGAHSGLPVGAAHDAASAVVAMQHGAPGLRRTVPMPTINFHGDADAVVHPRNGRFVAARALEPYGNLRKTEKKGHIFGGRDYVRTSHRQGGGRAYTESWVVAGTGHAWSGGHRSGSFTDPSGPDASREMLRFFLRHRTTKKRRSTPHS